MVSTYRRTSAGTCGLHTYTAHRRLQLLALEPVRELSKLGKEGMVQAPIARIGNVLARHGVPQRRSPQWVEDANARQIARVNEAILALSVR